MLLQIHRDLIGDHLKYILPVTLIDLLVGIFQSRSNRQHRHQGLPNQEGGIDSFYLYFIICNKRHKKIQEVQNGNGSFSIIHKNPNRAIGLNGKMVSFSRISCAERRWF